jgi:hypothetical protein
MPPCRPDTYVTPERSSAAKVATHRRGGFRGSHALVGLHEHERQVTGLVCSKGQAETDPTSHETAEARRCDVVTLANGRIHLLGCSLLGRVRPRQVGMLSNLTAMLEAPALQQEQQPQEGVDGTCLLAL